IMRSLRGILLLVIVAMVSACTGKPVKTYEGAALPDKDVAILTASDNIEVIEIDGTEMTTYLLSNIETMYALKPGKHRIVFNYTSVWSVAPKGQDGPRSEAVESPAQVVEIEVKAGDSLSFEFDDVENIREARAFAERFTANLVDSQGNVLGASDLYVKQVEQEMGEQVAVAGVQAGQLESKAAGLPPLEAMKVIWEGASTEDKKAFLKWAFK
ncbi:hypothetical protein A3737_22215, partial [Oleiphilus sp. HI0065]